MDNPFAADIADTAPEISAPDPAPALSVIVTMYNRAHCIRRCLESILSQPFRDYKLIVVDDGSADDSAARVEAIGDPRIRLVRLGQNRGVNAARTAAIEACRAEWIVSVDSDDELVPGVLGTVFEQISRLRPPVNAAAFACRFDNGRISPDPPVSGELDYAGYLAYQNTHQDGMQDVLNCLRRESFQSIPVTTGLEEAFLIEFHRANRTWFSPMLALLVHQDAGNQLGQSLRRPPAENLQFTRQRIASMTAVLERHGAAMRQHAPHMYWLYNSRLAVLAFAAGERGRGLRHSLEALRAEPMHPRSWAVPLFGLLGEATLRRARAVKQRLKARAA